MMDESSKHQYRDPQVTEEDEEEEDLSDLDSEMIPTTDALMAFCLPHDNRRPRIIPKFTPVCLYPSEKRVVTLCNAAEAVNSTTGGG